ncbi:MAG: ABC transporter substrate-binding protein [Candidatus Peribacteraceae bacterium]|nr:ABC transporter substrate-binding protein [Candidatus Peribacteraceae bacterium]
MKSAAMRIASLSPAITEILFALGREKQIVCTDQFSDWPEKAKILPHLKDHQKINIATLREYQADLIFTSTLVQQKLAEQLKADGLPVVHQDPRSLGDIYENIRTLGMLLEAEPEARELIARMQFGFSQVKKKVGILSKRFKVYVEEWHNPPMVSGNWVPEVVQMAGGIPLSLPRGSASREVTLHEVQTFNPDMIVLSICGAGSAANKSLIDLRAGWKDLPAVLKGRVFVIDDSLLNRPGPRLVEGAQRLYGWMFQLAHGG